MYLALFLVAILYLYIAGEEKTKLYKFSSVAAVLILFPLTGWILDKYFQNFYKDLSLQWLLPIFALIAFAAVDIYNRQTVKWKKYLVIPAMCLVLLLSGFVSNSYAGDDHEVKGNGNLAEIEDIYRWILGNAGERQIVLVAPRELMENARAYDGRLLTAYGRDIWEADLDYAFYGNYEEWAYGLSEHMNKSIEDNEKEVLAELARSGATHVVFDKENLTFDQDMHYPAEMKSGAMTLKRMEETRHYVIYTKAK